MCVQVGQLPAQHLRRANIWEEIYLTGASFVAIVDKQSTRIHDTLNNEYTHADFLSVLVLIRTLEEYAKYKY